jgi:hypothetical protein
VLSPLVNVLDRDQTAQQAVLVDDGELLDSMAAENPLRFVERGADRRRDQPLLRHDRSQRPVEVALELQITVRDDPDQTSILVDDRHTGDAESHHERVRLAEARLGSEGDRVEDHPALGALHAVDLGGLSIDRHVLVDHADPAGSRDGDRHLGLGDGVHRRRDERHVQRDPAREPRRDVDVAWVRRGAPRHEENVVEGQGYGLADSGCPARRLFRAVAPLDARRPAPGSPGSGPILDVSISGRHG